MTSAIAILTYNRLHALKEELHGLSTYCPQYRTAVFEDLGQRDGTRQFLSPAVPVIPREDLMADCYNLPSGISAFLGTKNLGVAGNSNRAIRWFMEETDADHLCLLNDDLHVLGDFVQFYAKAHQDLGVGMFCFCDFTAPTYRWVDIKKRGYNIKLCPRMTGIMISLTRAVVERIGYFDVRFGRFGEEHCDFTVRARLAGAIALDGMMQQQIDLHHYMVGEQPKMLLKHQDVETSVTGPERQEADREASVAMRHAAESYRCQDTYRPFRLHLPRFAGGTRGAGVPVDSLLSSYTLVTDFWPKPL